jgi:hypothetical protein
MWQNLLSAIGKGAAKGFGTAGKGIKTGATWLGREFENALDEEDGDPGMMTTPPFMPRQTQKSIALPIGDGRRDLQRPGVFLGRIHTLRV